MSTSIAPVENLSAAQLDTLCINTIRALSIDAVPSRPTPGTRNAHGTRAARLYDMESSPQI